MSVFMRECLISSNESCAGEIDGPASTFKGPHTLQMFCNNNLCLYLVVKSDTSPPFIIIVFFYSLHFAQIVH